MAIGLWDTDNSGLPYFEYTGDLPFYEKLSNGEAVNLPDDPWFILGNYRFTLFAHVSGGYELINGQRSWARLNSGARHNSGVNSSTVTINGTEYALTGMQSLLASSGACQRCFSCGFADYTYKIGNMSVSRNFSVKPSHTPQDGVSAFVLTVSFHNSGNEPADISFTESLGVDFEPIQYRKGQNRDFPVKYGNQYRMINGVSCIEITADSDDPLIAVSRAAKAKYDIYPPTVYMLPVSDEVAVSGDDRELRAAIHLTLKPNESRSFRLVIGFTFEPDELNAEQIRTAFSTDSDVTGVSSAYANEWRSIIPDFANESDADLRRELQWHAYCLEAMATYSEYYEETKIPQGTVYDYDWGCHASARDNFQHALPLCYYNPALAKSVLRYMMKRTAPDGEIRLIEYGNGCAEREQYFTSDQQLYFFMLMIEYLYVTQDYGFLTEMIPPYPYREMHGISVLQHIENCFVYLRDTVGVGAHGLVRLLNSDWNDTVYFMEKVPYNSVLMTGESHMNSAMAASIIPELVTLLKNAVHSLPGEAENLFRLCNSMSLYSESISAAFVRDLDDRPFPRRMYFNWKAYGEENMFLEPLGFMLQMDGISTQKKQAIYAEMRKRLYAGEKLGARQQESPEFESEGFEKGSRENGGFWWALNGPVIIGVSWFDEDEAFRLLKKMTLKNLSESFPQYWTSYWSAADNLESSLMPGEGLPDQTYTYWNVPVFCAHPHAWILYCYYRLNYGISPF